MANDDGYLYLLSDAELLACAGVSFVRDQERPGENDLPPVMVWRPVIPRLLRHAYPHVVWPVHRSLTVVRRRTLLCLGLRNAPSGDRQQPLPGLA